MKKIILGCAIISATVGLSSCSVSGSTYAPGYSSYVYSSAYPGYRYNTGYRYYPGYRYYNAYYPGYRYYGGYYPGYASVGLGGFGLGLGLGLNNWYRPAYYGRGWGWNGWYGRGWHRGYRGYWHGARAWRHR